MAGPKDAKGRVIVPGDLIWHGLSDGFLAARLVVSIEGDGTLITEPSAQLAGRYMSRRGRVRRSRSCLVDMEAREKREAGAALANAIAKMENKD